MQIRTCALCGITELLPNSMWRGIKLGVRVLHKKCYYKEYAVAHKDEVAKNKMNWILADPKRFKLTQIRYKESGKAAESLQKRIAKDPAGHSKRAVARANKAKELNPEKYLAYQASYQRIRQAQLLMPINTYYLATITEFYLGCPVGLEVDHILPLKNEMVSGLHVPWNLQYLTRTQNAKKSNAFDGSYQNESWKNE